MQACPLRGPDHNSSGKQHDKVSLDEALQNLEDARALYRGRGENLGRQFPCPSTVQMMAGRDNFVVPRRR